MSTGGTGRTVCGGLLVLLTIAGCGGATSREAPGATAGKSGEPELLTFDEIGGDFTLTDQHGRPFRMAEAGGRIRFLFFGYAMCPDVCPQTLSKVTRVKKILGEAGTEVLTLFISVDTGRDTPESLRDYVASFRLGDVVALSGSREEIDPVVELYKATYQRSYGGTAIPSGYLIGHTSYLFLIDRRGVTRAIFRFDEKPETIAQAVRALQREQPAG